MASAESDSSSNSFSGKLLERESFFSFCAASLYNEEYIDIKGGRQTTLLERFEGILLWYSLYDVFICELYHQQNSRTYKKLQIVLKNIFVYKVASKYG